MFLQLKCRFPMFQGGLLQGVCSWGGLLPGGLLWGCLLWGVCSQGGLLGGVSALGGLLQGGCLLPGGLLPGGSAPGGCLLLGGLLMGGSALGGVCSGGVPCDLSHHAFDVTCMLPPHQLRHTNCAPAYILPGDVTCKASWDTPSPVDRQTPVKT